jgi:DNA-binding MarR family transcriptional regulator
VTVSKSGPKKKAAAEPPLEKGSAGKGPADKLPADKGALPPGCFAYEGLDRVLHEKARLGILMALAAATEGRLFGELKQLCTLTDGNLNRHLDVLVKESLVEIWKGSENNRSKTLCRISRTGRERFAAYLTELERVLRDAGSRK